MPWDSDTNTNGRKSSRPGLRTRPFITTNINKKTTTTSSPPRTSIQTSEMRKIPRPIGALQSQPRRQVKPGNPLPNFNTSMKGGGRGGSRKPKKKPTKKHVKKPTRKHVKKHVKKPTQKHVKKPKRKTRRN